TLIHRLVGKIKLRGEKTASRRLHLDVIVPGTAGIDRRHDSAEAERAVRPRDDVATITETGVVVFALLIRMPQINTRALKRTAASGQDKARKFGRTALGTRLAQVTALWRFWFEKWSVALAHRRFIAVATGRRRRKLLRQTRAGTGQFPPRGQQTGVQQKAAASGFR